MGFSHWVGSECTEEITGIMGVPCGKGMRQRGEEGHQHHGVGSAGGISHGGAPGGGWMCTPMPKQLPMGRQLGMVALCHGDS